VRPLDLTHTTTVSGQQYISFLSLTWALIADMDFESEKYRYFIEKYYFIEIQSYFIEKYTYFIENCTGI
jgi:hypothetical protein